MKKLIKNNIKLIISFMLGAVIFSFITAYAATTIAGSNITYDNTSSGITSTNVQDAIDELYEKAKNSSSILYHKVNFTFSGNPSTTFSMNIKIGDTTVASKSGSGTIWSMSFPTISGTYNDKTATLTSSYSADSSSFQHTVTWNYTYDNTTWSGNFSGSAGATVNKTYLLFKDGDTLFVTQI